MHVLAVTGSSGALGRAVARALGPAVDRLVLRDPARAPRLHGASPALVRAEYGRHADSVAALAGIDLLFMVSAAEAPGRRAQHRDFIAAAAEAGVRHIVYTSFVGAAADAVFTLGRDHFDAEQAIRDSGMAFTLLRDQLYSDFLPLLADEHGVIRGPAGDGRVAGVARADVADAAVAVLRDPDPNVDAVYELTGPEAITMTEAASRLSAALKRPFSFVDQTEEQAYASRRGLSAEQWQLDAWVSTYTAIRDGTADQVTDDVRRLTGHAPRTLEQAVRPTA